jgi:FAD:protein FMN transferase
MRLDDRDNGTLSRRAFLALGGAAVVGAAAWRFGATRQAAALRGLNGGRFVAMGTYLELTVSETAGGHVLPAALDAARRVEERMSYFLPASELSRLNATAAGAPVPLSAELRAVLETARATHLLTHGSFDPSVPPLLEAWGFREGRPTRVPSREDVRVALARVGLGRLTLAGDTATLNAQDMALDLGGIAKGYGADRAAAALAAAGQTGLVNAGGDIRAAGPQPDGSPWRIGVRDPLRPDGLLATLELSGATAVATSGTYEQYAELDGRRVSHIVDPRSGETTTEVVSATILAPTAMQADALATACIVLPAAEGLRVLATLPGVEGLLVRQRTGGGHAVETTSGLRATLLRDV